MTKIDFYQISGDEQTFACRLIDKVYRAGHRIYVHTGSARQAEELDDHLWVFREDSFIPHALHSVDIEAPVKIGHDHEPSEHQEVLINLSGAVPDFFHASTGLQKWCLMMKIDVKLLVIITPTISSEATNWIITT